MNELDAARAGTFRIGGEIEINRLGFGAMRITGPGIWGQPKDRDEALRVLSALQYVEKHGEVCPADWKPGAATIKPTVKESKEYFSKVK